MKAYQLLVAFSPPRVHLGGLCPIATRRPHHFLPVAGGPARVSRLPCRLATSHSFLLRKNGPFPGPPGVQPAYMCPLPRASVPSRSPPSLSLLTRTNYLASSAGRGGVVVLGPCRERLPGSPHSSPRGFGDRVHALLEMAVKLRVGAPRQSRPLPSASAAGKAERAPSRPYPSPAGRAPRAAAPGPFMSVGAPAPRPTAPLRPSRRPRGARSPYPASPAAGAAVTAARAGRAPRSPRAAAPPWPRLRPPPAGSHRPGRPPARGHPLPGGGGERRSRDWPPHEPHSRSLLL